MKCMECGTETADADLVCAVCGAPTGRQPPVPADSVGGTPGASLGTVLAPSVTAGLPAVRTRGGRLRVAGGIVAAAATAPIGAVVPLPSFYYHGAPVSLWSDIPAAWSVEPLGVAILGLCAGIVMARGRVSGRRWLAAGMLLAFGTQMCLYSWGTQVGITPPDTVGSAGIVGMIGGLMLVTAGVLGAVGNAADRATSDQVGSQGISHSPNVL